LDGPVFLVLLSFGSFTTPVSLEEFQCYTSFCTMKCSHSILRKAICHTWAYFFIVTGILTLAACGVRPYDYIAPDLQTLSASIRGTPSPGVIVEMVPTFTPPPYASPTTKRTLTASPTVSSETPSPTTMITPLEGLAQVLLENRTGATLVVSLEGTQAFGYEITPGAALEVQIPAGVYQYWLILPGQQNLRGEKVFYPGASTWTFYRTPGVVESPTPRWSEILP
jgi:hypothetical protein